MLTSLSSLIDNLSEKLYGDKCKYCKSELDYMSLKDDQLIFRCSECKKNYEKDFNKDLIDRSGNTYRFCNEDINKFFFVIKKRRLSL